MLVKLHRPVFLAGVRYRSRNNEPVEIPEEFREKLPKDAEVLPEPDISEPVVKKSKKGLDL